MQEAQQILSKLKNVKTSLKRRYGVTEVALFGSYSRGEAQHDSYIELLVTFDKNPGLRFTDLEEELEQLLERKVDVTMRKGIEQQFYKSIRKELLYV
ncbi:MAG: nucleotidyltransferase domain-containing protein [Chitinophagaceae bacterium]|nr:nucleotidyltransferase domain-containing protein [Chitinophagaceae bacterium]MCB9044882.1 nucleotidyltransferase domain-containing protein [Chitinophagales bacterium]